MKNHSNLTSKRQSCYRSVAENRNFYTNFSQVNSILIAIPTPASESKHSNGTPTALFLSKER
jgi:hypothetical protein